MTKEKQNNFNGFKMLFKFMNGKQKFEWIAIYLLSFISAFLTLIPVQFVAVFIDKFNGDVGNIFGIRLPDSLSFWGIGAIALGLVLLKIFIEVFKSWWSWKLSIEVTLDLKKTAYKWSIQPKANKEKTENLGDVAYRITKNTESADTFVEGLMDYFVPDLIAGLISFIYLCLINIIYLPIILIIMTAFILSIKYRMDKTRHQTIVREDLNAGLNDHTINCLQNNSEITLKKAEEYEVMEYENKLSPIRNNWIERHKILRRYWYLVEGLQGLAIVMVLGIGLSNVLAGVLSIGTLMILFQYTNNIFDPLKLLGIKAGELEIANISLKRVFALRRSYNLESYINSKKINKIESIELRGVNLTYDEKFKITNVNMNFLKNELTVISGVSGSGKTSIANLLCGLIKKDSGQIIINKTNEALDMALYLGHISYAQQAAYLFNRSIEENIAYPDKPEDLIYLNTLIKDYNIESVIKRNQSDKDCCLKLSGGEEKRIMLARNSKPGFDVYIFDEPTNELDNYNVRLVLNNLNKLKENSIVIVISHDKRVLEIADKEYAI